MGTERSGDCGIRVVMEESGVRVYQDQAGTARSVVAAYHQWILIIRQRTIFSNTVLPWISAAFLGRVQGNLWRLLEAISISLEKYVKKHWRLMTELRFYTNVRQSHTKHQWPLWTVTVAIAKLKFNLRTTLRSRRTKRITSQRTDNPLAMDSWPPSAGDRT